MLDAGDLPVVTTDSLVADFDVAVGGHQHRRYSVATRQTFDLAPQIRLLRDIDLFVVDALLLEIRLKQVAITACRMRVDDREIANWFFNWHGSDYICG